MSILPLSNTSPSKSEDSALGPTPEKPARPKKKGKNLNQIHSKPLPLEIHPLPAFHPTNPISLLRLAYTWISHIIFPPVSHPAEPYVGYFSAETRSVHITNPDHVRALWEMGFFGKGTLSRSEPNWLEREKARLRREKFGAEDATNARRDERRLFKLERARLEAEKIERQRLVEEGKVDAEGSAEVGDDSFVSESTADPGLNGHIDAGDKLDSNTATTTANGDIEAKTAFPPPNNTPQRADTEDDYTDPFLQNQEHLQLTPTETFFLAYGLGVLSIYPPSALSTSPPMSPKSSPQALTTIDLLQLCIQHFTFPPQSLTPDLTPDEPFLLHYTTYHHYRSLGWVIRPGIKFGCDYLLYNRGPAFSHAEFGIIVLPAYTHRFWNTPGGRLRRRNSVVERESVGRGSKDWSWLHAVNRVQSQVKKTLVLCYVDVPSPWEIESFLGGGEDGVGEVDVTGLLKCYRVREFVVRRWVPNRTRD